MTVENTNPIQHFTANGATTVFAINFEVEGKDNIKVTVDCTTVSVNDYSYDASVNAVVFNTAPAADLEVIIERVTSLDRSINYQTYNNSFRPETLNYDLDRIWHVLQEDHITDAEILARIKDEIEWRRTHNTEWDLLAQAREGNLFNALKSYMDAIGAMSVPNLFDGITDNVVITEEGVSQRVTNRGLKQAQAELLAALNALDGTVNVNLAEAKTYTDNETARAIAEETRISNTVVAETNRAVDAEAVLQGQINALGVGNKAYKTYAEMVADKAAITAKSKVTVTNDPDNELNGDYQYDGTAFTKSVYDVLTQAKGYADANPLFNPVSLTFNANIDNLEIGLYIIPSDSIAATVTGLPPQLTQPRRGFIFSIRRGTTNYQRFIRDYSTKAEAYERTGNGKSYGAVDFSWLDWKAANAESTVETFRVGNDLLAPKILASDADLNVLGYGVYLVGSSATASTILNLPNGATTPKLGIVLSYNISGSIKYQRFIRYTEMGRGIEIFDRVTNGGSSSNQWTEWRKSLTSQDISGFASLNLFQYPRFENKNTAYYQATTSTEDGFTVLNMTPGFTYVMYDMDISSSEQLKAGDTISFSADIKSDDTGMVNGGDISIECYAGSSGGSKLGSTVTDTNEVAGEWQLLTVGTTIPEGTNRLRLRFINRGGTNTYCKFRKPKLTSSSWYATNISLNGSSNSGSSVGSLNLFVAKSGSEVNSGTYTSPYASIQQAVNAIGDLNGTITILDSEWYREAVNISSKGNITLQSARNHRAKVVGSNQLVLTKTSGFTKVYQAPLIDKPTGMGGARGKPMIAEWGTPSSLITARDIHHLQRGERFRLPYTEMFEVATKEAVEAQNGVWYWENGIIYLSATDGSDATQKQYEARIRAGITHSNGSINLYRMDIFLANGYGFVSSGISVYREDCRIYGSKHNGFADNANSTVSYRDMSLNNGNDGFNGTVSSYTTENLTTAVQATYFDPYGALNGDDGISFHIRGTCNIYGGLFEYNTKASVVHVTGGGGNCYNTIARGQNFGFYTATAAPDGRNLSTMHCHNTISERNGHNYCAGSEGSELYCFGTISIDPITAGYSNLGGKVVARNCKYNGDTAKAKSGTIEVINDSALV